MAMSASYPAYGARSVYGAFVGRVSAGHPA